MIKSLKEKIIIIWNNFTLIRLMRIIIIALIIFFTKNITIIFFELNINEFLPFISIFVFFGLIRLTLMYYIRDVKNVTKKDIIFITILIILCTIFVYCKN